MYNKQLKYYKMLKLSYAINKKIELFLPYSILHHIMTTSENIKFKNTIPEQFLCSVCNNINGCIYRNTSVNDIIYCDKCKDNNEESCKKDDLLTQVIQNYIIYCPNALCEKEFIYANLSSHLNGECCFTYKTCPNLGCDYSALIVDYSHEKCEYAIINKMNNEIVLLQNENEEHYNRIIELEIENNSLQHSMKRLNHMLKKVQNPDIFNTFLTRSIIENYYNIYVIPESPGSYNVWQNVVSSRHYKTVYHNGTLSYLNECSDGTKNYKSVGAFFNYIYCLYVLTDTLYSYDYKQLTIEEINYNITNKIDFPTKSIHTDFKIKDLIMFIKLYEANLSIEEQDILFVKSGETSDEDRTLLEEYKEFIEEFDKKDVDWNIYIISKNSKEMADYVRHRLEKYKFIKFV